jgi:hypothetical protein
MVRRVNLLPSTRLLWTAFCVVFTGTSLSAQSNASLRLGPIARSPFLVAPSFSLSAAPTSVAAGDLNGDGHLDLVLTKKNSGKVTVLLGDGKGGVSTGVDYPAATQAGNALVADLNGDGKLDVAVTDAAGAVDVLFGNGDGTLGTAASYAAQTTPAAFAVGNFAGKGKIDLAVAGANGLSVLVNDGTGHFSAAGSLPLAVQPHALAAADLRSTGHDDLVLANQDGSITVLLGDGSGNFRAQSALSVAAGSLSAIATGDFNGDGKRDLAVAVAGSNAVAVLLGHGDGSFAPAVSYAVGNGPAALVAADLRSNGVTDLVSVNQTANTFSVLLGNGDGTFHASSEFVSGNTPIGLAAGDFNNDGHADVAIVNNVDATVAVPLGRGDGSFAASRVYRADLERKAIASGDLNGDGHPDLVVTNFCGSDASCASNGSATVFLATSSGAYEAASSLTLGNGPIAVALADLNGDKKLDLLALNQIDKSMMVMLGNGDGTFGAPQLYSLSASPRALYVGDFNGDGKADLAIAADCGQSTCSQPGSLDIWLGHGDGSLADSASYTVGYAPVSIAAADLRGTGHLDLVVANSCGDSGACTGDGTGTLLANDGVGRFTQMSEIDLGLAPSSIALGNLSGTGLDLAVAQRSNNQIAVLHSNGNGTFGAPTTYSVGSAPSALTIADLNGDGLQDVAVANFQSSTVSVLYGTGAGTLRSTTTYPVSAGPDALVAVTPLSGTMSSLVTANGDTGSTPMGNGITALGGTGGTTPSTTTITSTANTSIVDTQVAIAASVSGTGGPPTGSVVFAIDASGTGAGPFTYLADCGGAAGLPLSGGSVTCNTQLLPAGTDNIQAQYFGDATFATSASSDQGQTISAAGTTTTVSPTTASTYGQSVTLTATVAPTSSITVTSNDIVAFTGTVAFFYDNGGGPTSIAGCNNVTAATNQATENATASCITSSPLPVGANSITAQYKTGDPNYNTSTSAPVTQTVNQASTTTTLAAAPSSAFVALNTNVTFTATINLPSGATAAPTGSVTFTDNGIALSGCGALSSSAPYTAACSTSTLAGGSHSIVATYSGDANYTASGGSVSLTVIPGSTTTVVTPSANPSNVGQQVTFTATVSPTVGTFAPTGTVSFQNNGVTITACSTVGLSSATATCTIPFTAATASATIKATYSGDSNYNPSNGSVNQVVNAGSTTTTLASSPNPSNVGQQVVFTATIALPSGATVAPGGTVNFTNNGTTISGCGTATISATSPYTATCTTSFTAVGSAGANTIAAVYSGDPNYATSTSLSVGQTVNQSATSVLLAANPTNPTLNQQVVFTATVMIPSGATTAPTGTVTFTDDNTPIAACGTNGVVTVAASTATCTVASLTATGHTIVATYSGDSNYLTSFGNLGISLNGLSTTTTISAAPNPSTVNQAVTFTVNVQGSTTVQLTGTAIVIADGTIDLGRCAPTWDSGTGLATCTVTSSTLGKGTHSITASYSGDANYNSSSTGTPVLQQTVSAETTTLTLSALPSSPTVNQPVTFTATIGFTSGSTPLTGSVAFTDSVTNSAIPGCTAQAIDAATGMSTCTTSTLAVGTHTITATYSDSTGNFSGSSNTLTETVSSATISMNFLTSPTSGIVNQATPITFSAVITAPSGTTSLTGKVAFTDNGTTIAACSAVAPSADGTSGSNSLWLAACPDSALTAAGSPHTIAASYTGDTNFGNTSATLGSAITIAPAATSIAVTAAPNPSSLNQSVTFTSTLSAPSGGVALAGKVSITDPSQVGLATACPATTPPANGVVTCSYSGLTIGSHTITVAFSGDPNFSSSSNSSAPLTQIVAAATTATTLTANPTSATFNTPVTFTATVATVPATAKGSTAFSGSMAFTDNGTAIPTCASVPVNGATGVATCVTSTLPAGADTIIATYSGDSNFGNSAASLTEQVTAASATIILTPATPAPILAVNPNGTNDSVTFTASIFPAYSGTVPLSGTMVFNDTITSNGTTSSAAICRVAPSTSGVAVCSCPSASCTLPSGQNTITASYTGDSNLTPAPSAAVSQLVEDYSLVVSSAPPVAVTQGFTTSNDLFSSQTISVSPTSISGFTTASGQPLSLKCTVAAVAPATGATAPLCTLGASTVTVAASGTPEPTVGIVIDATKATAGTYSATLNATDPTTGLARASTPFSIIVRSVAGPLTLVSGATTGNTATVSFLLPASVSLSQIACVNVAGPNLSSMVAPSALSIGCSFNPTTIAAAASQQSGNTSVTISTGTTTSGLARHTDLLFAGLLGIPFFGLFGLLRGRRSIGAVLLRLIAIAAIGFAAFQTMGCGGSFHRSTVTGGGQTPPGAYDVLITGTGSDGNTYQAVLSLNVTL